MNLHNKIKDTKNWSKVYKADIFNANQALLFLCIVILSETIVLYFALFNQFNNIIYCVGFCSEIFISIIFGFIAHCRDIACKRFTEVESLKADLIKRQDQINQMYNEN